jgi:hypothetical protein
MRRAAAVTPATADPKQRRKNTRTGRTMEDLVEVALQRGGYAFKKQVNVGERCGGGGHRIDFVATREGDTILVSTKWQEIAGTAEQKVPYEVMCLADAVRSNPGTRAYVVLGGEAWKLRDYFTSGKLREHLKHAELVRIETLEGFVRLANRGEM